MQKENEKDVIKQGTTLSIPRELLSGIRRLNERQTPDRNLRGINDVKAFTLIELLVVVLIIGILAAVALPQYQKAVEKARLATLIPVVKALANAKSEHYLATGEWARTFDVLSVEVPPEFTVSDDNYYGQKASFGAKKMWLFVDEAAGTSTHAIIGMLRLSDNSSLSYKIVPGESNIKSTCWGDQNKRADDLCKSIPGAVYSHNNTAGDITYNIYNLN